MFAPRCRSKPTQRRLGSTNRWRDCSNMTNLQSRSTSEAIAANFKAPKRGTIDDVISPHCRNIRKGDRRRCVVHFPREAPSENSTLREGERVVRRRFRQKSSQAWPKHRSERPGSFVQVLLLNPANSSQEHTSKAGRRGRREGAGVSGWVEG